LRNFVLIFIITFLLGVGVDHLNLVVVEVGHPQPTLDKEVEEAIRQGRMQHERIHGKGGGNMNRELGDMLEPQIDWREALREFVTSVCNAKDASSWRRVNRRFVANDIYMPSMIGERVGRLVVGVDTSGSINAEALTNFLTEVRSIAEVVRPEAIDLIYWDARVAGHEEYVGDDVANLVASTKPMGGGGTDVGCLFSYVEKELRHQPVVCVVLSDGYTPFPEPPLYPVLFVFTSDVVAPWGKTVRIND
jgi:predicted metal-dependent peptidase